VPMAAWSWPQQSNRSTSFHQTKPCFERRWPCLSGDTAPELGAETAWPRRQRVALWLAPHRLSVRPCVPAGAIRGNRPSAVVRERARERKDTLARDGLQHRRPHAGPGSPQLDARSSLQTHEILTDPFDVDASLSRKYRATQTTPAVASLSFNRVESKTVREPIRSDTKRSAARKAPVQDSRLHAAIGLALDNAIAARGGRRVARGREPAETSSGFSAQVELRRERDELAGNQPATWPSTTNSAPRPDAAVTGHRDGDRPRKWPGWSTPVQIPAPRKIIGVPGPYRHCVQAHCRAQRR